MVKNTAKQQRVTQSQHRQDSQKDSKQKAAQAAGPTFDSIDAKATGTSAALASTSTSLTDPSVVNALAQKNNVISDRVLSVVAFIITSGYILLVVLDMLAEALNYDLIPLQTFIYYMAPVLICLVAAYLFNALATFQGRSWWNLASCIMYIATIAVYPALWYLVAIQTILTFFSFFRMHNREMKAAAKQHIANTQDVPLVDTPNEEMARIADKKPADKN